MQEQQEVGIDLPLRILVCEGADGRTWLAYDDPRRISERHGLGETAHPVIEAMRGLLASVATEAAANQERMSPSDGCDPSECGNVAAPA